MKEPWRNLKVGDRVRIARLPSRESLDGYVLPADTRRIYRLLMKRKRILEIDEIDKRWRLPWIKFTLKTEDGLEHHWLALNDDSWFRVKKRRKNSVPKDRAT
jgi:hypothetical protein